MPTTAPSAPSIASRLATLELMVFDVDGVLTDGCLHYGPAGEAIKVFHVHDGLGLEMLRKSGVKIAILSGRSSPIVLRRAEDLGFHHVLQGIKEKGAAIRQLAEEFAVPLDCVGYMGDDVIDIPALRLAGFAATVPNASAHVFAHAHYTTVCSGGRGAVREVCELIMASQGKLDSALSAYVRTP